MVHSYPSVVRCFQIGGLNSSLGVLELRNTLGIMYEMYIGSLGILYFLEVYDTVKYNGVSVESIPLQLFPFSLKEKAKNWLISEPPNSITLWDELVNKFLARFFPLEKAAKLRIYISNFFQYEGETFMKHGKYSRTCW